MAKVKQAAEDYLSLDAASLKGRVEDEEMRLKKMRFSHAVNPMENPLALRHLRRTIARMKTEQRKRDLGN